MHAKAEALTQLKFNQPVTCFTYCPSYVFHAVRIIPFNTKGML